MKAAGGIGLAHCNYSKMPIQKGIYFQDKVSDWKHHCT